MVDEQASRIRLLLEEKFGVEAAAYLTDRPVGGWSTLVTERTLVERLTTLRSEVVAEMHREFRAQTWRPLATLTVMIALFGVILTVVARS